MLHKLRRYAPNQSVGGQRLKYALMSMLYILIYFIPNIICRIFYGTIYLLIWGLKLLVLPGNFIFSNIKNGIN